jgi:hypothetical protein
MRREQAEQRLGRATVFGCTCWLPRPAAAFCAAPRSSTGSRRTSAWLRAREPIFSETHTNEFCGIGKSTPEPAGPCAPLRPGRWVYEKGEETCSCGEDVESLKKPWHLSTAAFAGRCWSHFILRRLRVVPYGLPGYRRLRRAPPQHRCCPGASARGPPRHLGRLCRRKGIPHVRRGVGYVGAWRFARPLQSHRGYLPVGDASGLNLPVGPPLGALRRRFRGALAPRSRPPTALWGIQEGKADVTRGKTGARRTSSAATRAQCPPTQ